MLYIFEVIAVHFVYPLTNSEIMLYSLTEEVRKMEIMAVVTIFLVLVSFAVKSPKIYTPTIPRNYQTYTQIRSGHWERRITGYKLQRNFAYDQLKENWNWSDQHMHRMGFQEYTLIPEYDWVWVSN